MQLLRKEFHLHEKIIERQVVRPETVLPILGMGRLGKTTLSQMVFNYQRVTEHFNPKIWICVSEDFNEKRLIKAIVESIEETSLDEMNLSPLQKICLS
ncbi:hypothetical protein R3W88_032244 [Solanum pinnatisectum]|uniref:NB-ARC domain-containing protein n=1 Tax=Solanum pinnatisectum TaxID=50273 RepID=A0AAV9LNL2_9SOLN|nr:hypothetical protein R3W88_032244 [Solanum pinnatisectum]